MGRMFLLSWDYRTSVQALQLFLLRLNFVETLALRCNIATERVLGALSGKWR